MVIEFSFLFSSQKAQNGKEEGLCKTALQEKYFMIWSKKDREHISSLLAQHSFSTKLTFLHIAISTHSF